MFFFYVLYRVSLINTLHDKIINTAHDKYWEMSINTTTTTTTSDLKKLSDYLCIKCDTFSLFKLGPLEVRRGQLIATITGFLFYCSYVLLIVKKL